MASRAPRWRVKIADFGISKQAMEGGTHLRTMQIGTFGYMAPEVHGFFGGTQPSAYSVAVDIWAIGVITMELLVKRHPFSNISDFAMYVQGRAPLDLSGPVGEGLSESCRDFLGGLLTPNPATRPTAASATTHAWLTNGVPAPQEDSCDYTLPRLKLRRGLTDCRLFVQGHEALPGTPSGFRDTAMVTQVSLPNLDWSHRQISGSFQTGEETVTPLSTYHGPRFDVSALLPSFRALPLGVVRLPYSSPEMSGRLICE